MPETALTVSLNVKTIFDATATSVSLSLGDDELKVGAVVSARVTTVDFGDAVNDVCALPAVSVIENDAAAVRVDVTATPSAAADEVAVTVQTVDEVCTIPVIDEIFVRVKSVPAVVESVEQVMSSPPVTVNVIVAEVDVALDAAKVTVGAVVS